ncbi:hypothetical protein NL676_003736 [Syzygium grande]|nr:hypothetical protein NL676_003736 [Syzygium grande]
MYVRCPSRSYYRRGHSDRSSGSGSGSSSVAAVSSSNLHAYVKPPSAEVSTSGNKKPPRAAGLSSQEKSAVTRTNELKPANQTNSRKKKSGKVMSLAEAAKGSVVFQQAKPIRAKRAGTAWKEDSMPVSTKLHQSPQRLKLPQKLMPRDLSYTIGALHRIQRLLMTNKTITELRARAGYQRR